MGSEGLRLRVIAAVVVFMLAVVPTALATVPSGSGGPEATASASLGTKFKRLKQKVNQLQQQL
jgi:hypothetical protein